MGTLIRGFLLLVLMPLVAAAQQSSSTDIGSELRKLNWLVGPASGPIAEKASIEVPDGYVFLDAGNTRRFIQLMGNPPVDNHYTIAPKALNWFAVFSFESTGYIKDDEKIDPQELLKQLQAADAPSNEERKRLGMAALYTDGWQVAPHYDSDTRRLEWGTRLRDERGAMNVNYTIRILGRTGVMSAVLVSAPATLSEDTRSFKETLRKFSYKSGEDYAEFKPGDKVAEYGLAALVLGGAAAVATKKGFWAVLGGVLAASWKLIAGVAVAGLAGLGRLFRKRQP